MSGAVSSANNKSLTSGERPTLHQVIDCWRQHTTKSSELEKARESFKMRRCADAYDRLSAYNRESAMELEDEELLATAAFLLGKDLESTEIWTRVQRRFLDNGNVRRAVRSTFWLALGLFNRGEITRGKAWVKRANHLLDKVQSDCVEQGYILLLEAFQEIEMGNTTDACSMLEEVAEIAERFDEPNLSTLAWHALGRALIRMGKNQEGVSKLDEAMAAVEAGDVSPVVIGYVYCSVISGCMEIFDIRRAQIWTSALMRWCESQPDLVAFNGQCQVHRAEILSIHGAWRDALEAAKGACRQCQSGPDQAAMGALYRLAELHMLRGEFAKAEDAYLQAGRKGYSLSDTG